MLANIFSNQPFVYPICPQEYVQQQPNRSLKQNKHEVH